MCDIKGKKPLKKIAMKPGWKKEWAKVQTIATKGKKLFLEHIQKGIHEAVAAEVEPDEFERILEGRTREIKRVQLDHEEALVNFFVLVESSDKKNLADKHLHVSEDQKFILVFKK